MTTKEPKVPQSESIVGGELTKEEIIRLIDEVEKGLGIELLPPTPVRNDIELPQGYNPKDDESNAVVYSTYDRLTGVNKMANTTPEQMGAPEDAMDLAEAGLFHKVYLELKNLSVHNPLKTGPIVVVGTEGRKVEPGTEGKDGLERRIAQEVTGLQLVPGDKLLDDEYQAAKLAAQSQDGFVPVDEKTKQDVNESEDLELIGHINGRPVYAHKVPYEDLGDGKYKTLTDTVQQTRDIMARLGARHATLATSNTYIPSRREMVGDETGITVTGYGTSELHKVKGEDVSNEIAQMLAEFYREREIARLK